jgi:hypothetical protein
MVRRRAIWSGVKFFTACQRAQDHPQAFFPRFRLFGSLQTIDDGVDIRPVEGGEKGFRCLVFLEFGKNVFRRRSISRGIVGGAPAPVGFCRLYVFLERPSLRSHPEGRAHHCRSSRGMRLSAPRMSSRPFNTRRSIGAFGTRILFDRTSGVTV